ncbi:MAG: glycosyltransferase family 4 protein [Proteobacteria bacterium]|nr:glycosyltransferase family 4 protein [Pseudomonadota bacterium]
MKILYHHRTQAEDAQGIHIYEMINAFREIGHEVSMVSLVKLNQGRTKKEKGKIWEPIAKFVPNFVYEIMEIGYNFYGYFLLARSIKKDKPDFIYERYSLNTFCGVWVSKKFQIPLVLEVNAPLYYECQKYGKLFFARFAKFSERWICSNSFRTIAVTNVMKRMLVKEGVPESHLIVMHNGINLDEFRTDIDGCKIRSKYNITSDKIVLGFVGWFRPWHGLDKILKIFKEKGLGRGGVHLLLCGDGPAYHDLYEYALQNNLLDYVTFTGGVDRKDVPAYIAAFDIALQPSVTPYASPMKIFEYIAMGKGVIAPKQDNICEILEDGYNAILFDANDENGLEKALITSTETISYAKKMASAASKTIIEKEYLWKSNAKKVVDLIS